MSRLRLTVETIAALVAVASLGCIAVLWRAHVLSSGTMGIALLVPAVASVLYVCVSFAVPDLYAVDRLRFPLTLTLPAVYMALIVLTVTLISRVGPSIARVSDRFNIMGIWARPSLLLVTFLGGVAALSILSVLANDKREPHS